MNNCSVLWFLQQIKCCCWQAITANIFPVGHSFQLNKAPYIKGKAQKQKEKASQCAPAKIAWDKTVCQNSCGTSRIGPFFLKPHWLAPMFSHRIRLHKRIFKNYIFYLTSPDPLLLPPPTRIFTLIPVTHHPSSAEQQSAPRACDPKYHRYLSSTTLYNFQKKSWDWPWKSLIIFSSTYQKWSVEKLEF